MFNGLFWASLKVYKRLTFDLKKIHQSKNPIFPTLDFIEQNLYYNFTLFGAAWL